MTRISLAALAALTLGTTLGTGSAYAQYGYGEDYPPPRRYERRYDDYDRPRYRRDYDEPRGYARRSSICVTARGNCQTRPAPYNSPCGCEVPGFGFKRGQIGG